MTSRSHIRHWLPPFLPSDAYSCFMNINEDVDMIDGDVRKMNVELFACNIEIFISKINQLSE